MCLGRGAVHGKDGQGRSGIRHRGVVGSAGTNSTMSSTAPCTALDEARMARTHQRSFVLLARVHVQRDRGTTDESPRLPTTADEPLRMHCSSPKLFKF